MFTARSKSNHKEGRLSCRELTIIERKEAFQSTSFSLKRNVMMMYASNRVQDRVYFNRIHASFGHCGDHFVVLNGGRLKRSAGSISKHTCTSDPARNFLLKH